MSPRVPVCIEPLDTLRARYPAAVTDLIDAQAVRDGQLPSPSSNRRHVFDTPDGWRLIISREQVPSGLIAVHLSASVHSPLLHRRLQQHNQSWSFENIFRLWRYLARSDRTPTFVHLTKKGVPHFIIEQVS